MTTTFNQHDFQSDKFCRWSVVKIWRVETIDQ